MLRINSSHFLSWYSWRDDLAEGFVLSIREKPRNSPYNCASEKRANRDAGFLPQLIRKPKDLVIKGRIAV
jgi:hypothetical protein